MHYWGPAEGPADGPADAPASVEPLGALWRRRFGGTAAAAAWLGALDACLAEPGRQRPQSVAQLRALLQVHDAAACAQPQPPPSPWVLANGVGVGVGPEHFPMVAVPAAPVVDQRTQPHPGGTLINSNDRESINRHQRISLS